MPRELLLYILVVIMAGALSLFLCLFAKLKIKDAPGAKPYILVTLLSSIFTFSYAFELSSTSLEQIKFWLRVEYLALPFIPVFLLLMCIEYVGGVGRPVEIRTSRGTVHRGIVHRVTPNRVYIRPLDVGGNLGGFGYGGFNAGYGWGAANGFAFGAIASLVFLAFLW